MAIRTIVLLLTSFFFVILSFIAEQWFFAALGIMLAMLSGGWGIAILLSLVVDLLYGPPPGIFHWISFPFTFTAAILSFFIFIFIKQMRGKREQEFL